MKTSLMILAALSLGTAAAAQDSAMQPGGTAPVPTTAPTMPDQQTPSTAPTTPADGAMPAPADGASGSMPAPAPASPPMASPAPDASAPLAATSDYPACSRTMKDKCIQKGAPMKSRRK